MGGVQCLSRAGAVSGFGRFLVGAARASGSISGLGFDVSESETAFAIQPGAGVDFHLTDTVSARVMFDYRRIFFEGEGNNEIRVAAGLVFGFGSR